jgi:hypothetical protein
MQEKRQDLVSTPRKQPVKRRYVQLNINTINSGGPFTVQGISRLETSAIAGGSKAYGSFSTTEPALLCGAVSRSGSTMVEVAEAILL